jgi:hypothetical protein
MTCSMLKGNTIRQLRSYIAPGAPATRHPCDGGESPLRVEYGFTPRWYHHRLGIDFTERWHLDPLHRHETLVSMRTELDRTFPEMKVGSGPSPIMAGLDGVHGALIMAQIFGVTAEYYPDNWPAARHDYLSPEAIANLEMPDLSCAPVLVQLFKQMDVIERSFGRIEGYLNWQGVLNTAYRLRGPEVLADMLLNPGLAKHLFEVIANTMIAGMRLVYSRQGQTGVLIEHATVSNCLVNMVSPELYREQLLPWDSYIAAAFSAFGIHNCAWNVDPYIEAYASIHPLGYIDMGITSDLGKVKQFCPGARRAVMYTPMDLKEKSPEALQNDIKRIYRDLAPCDIVMADIDYEVPDNRVKEFDEIVQRVIGVRV